MSKRTNEPDLKQFLFYIMIFIVVVLCAYLIYYVKTGAVSCMASPLTYGVGHLRTGDNNSLISCTCSASNSKNTLYITKDNITEIGVLQNPFEQDLRIKIGNLDNEKKP